MKYRSILFVHLFSILMIIPCYLYAATKASIEGNITDTTTGQALPGANVFLAGTSIGTATNLNGKFSLTNIPPGEYTLHVKYIGYQAIEIPIQLQTGESLIKNIELESVVLQGQEVGITVQAEGQNEAINRQLTSRSIIEVVSSARIRELPDATAAESVARLPGVSLSREGGEGTKVVIRGMSSEHNKVNIEGIEIASTDRDNRSVDISMISPYMLESIEVQKAVTADHDGDAMGGTVNFIIREASPEWDFDVIAQEVHNGLRNTYEDYKLVGSIDNRFFNDLFGVFLQVDVENRTRDSETLTAEYQLPKPKLNQDNITYVNNVLLEDIYRDKKRLGGAVVLDYRLPTTHIKSVNFLSKIDTDVDTYSELCDAEGAFQGHRSSFREENISLLTNSIHVTQNFPNAKLFLRASRAESVNDVPNDAFWNFRNNSGLEAGFNVQTSPQDLFRYARNDTAAEFLRMIDWNSHRNEETIWEYKTDFEYDYAFSKQVAGKLKIGGKYKEKTRSYDHNSTFIDAYLESTKGARNAIIDYLGLSLPHDVRELPLLYFMDDSYDNDNYLNGDFSMGPFPDTDMLREVIHMISNSLFPASVYSGGEIVPDAVESIRHDYSGNEYYSGAYIMTDMKIGEKIEFNPGLRYEHNVTKYTGIRGDITTGGTPDREWTVWHDTTLSRSNDFWLPMIHLKVKPTGWLDIHLAYTESISRPDYTSIIPSYLINRTTIDDYGNIGLKPSHSENIDLQFSIHSNEIGLLTLGGFHKTIYNQIFATGGRVVPDSAAAYEYPGLEEYQWDNVIGSKIYTYVNNPNKGTVWGLEFGWQTHFWYLPSFLKGLVFNGNYTHIFSETKYPRTTIEFDYTTFQQTNNDTSYTARFINQPKDIVNLAFGYDYKGFSGRISMLYQSNVFAENDFWPELRATTAEYIRWDISIKQQLPVKNLDFTLNFVNLNAEIDKNINQSTGNPTLRENYGRNIIAGLRYTF
ncbi:TonB-dependent receptor [candidate division KSB1 bacterium]|nr:TonB-dependent receptor [candidate division KSB1 bacterium]